MCINRRACYVAAITLSLILACVATLAGKNRPQHLPVVLVQSVDNPRKPPGSEVRLPGFVYDKECLIITSGQAVRGWRRTTVRLTDDRVMPARVVVIDDHVDAAILQTSKARLSVAKLGQSSALRKGTPVVCAGWGHVRNGNISAVNAELKNIQGKVLEITSRDLRGCSPGTPVLDRSGAVVGMIVKLLIPQTGCAGIGPIRTAYAVPSETLKLLIKQNQRP